MQSHAHTPRQVAVPNSLKFRALVSLLILILAWPAPHAAGASGGHGGGHAALSASAGGPYTGETGVAITFSATASGGTGPYNYTWNFGDVSASGTGSSAQHAYTAEGTYTVTLTVTDSASRTAAATATVTVRAPPLELNAGGPYSGESGYAIAFSGSASGGTPPYLFDWDFGDGTLHASGPAASHVYSLSGNYTVTLAVSDSVNHRTRATTAHVSDPPTPIIPEPQYFHQAVQTALGSIEAAPSGMTWMDTARPNGTLPAFNPNTPVAAMSEASWATVVPLTARNAAAYVTVWAQFSPAASPQVGSIGVPTVSLGSGRFCFGSPYSGPWVCPPGAGVGGVQVGATAKSPWLRVTILQSSGSGWSVIGESSAYAGILNVPGPVVAHFMPISTNGSQQLKVLVQPEWPNGMVPGTVEILSDSSETPSCIAFGANSC